MYICIQINIINKFATYTNVWYARTKRKIMATKTFKIGEYAKGGVITAIATKTKVTIIGKDWDTSKGFNKGSDQSNAKEWTRLEVSTSDSDADRKLTMFLLDLTTSYYTDQIIDWCKSKSDLNKRMFW